MDAIHQFFSLGTQYYVVGRFSAFAGLNPVTGNQLHHAIEMFVKGALSKTKSLSDLKRLGHSLPRVWAEFKQQTGDSSLNRFDPVITQLDKFETIRYPDEILSKGMSSTINIVRSPPFAGSVAGVPHYEVCLEDVDELVDAIFVAASRNPKSYLVSMLMKPEAREYVTRENKVSGLSPA